MNKDLIKVALRYNAIYFSQDIMSRNNNSVSRFSMIMQRKLYQYGYTLSEQALHIANAMNPAELNDIAETMDEVLRTKMNWASLTKNWLVPTGEDGLDHFITMLANITCDNPLQQRQLRQLKHFWGLDNEFTYSTLQCGHIIPEGTFPLERYNGCPFCGTPFHVTDYVHLGQGSNNTILEVWGDEEMLTLRDNLLTSPTPLDATQAENLKVLISTYGMPKDCNIVIKENIVIVNSIFLEIDPDRIAPFTSPVDIMRLLWYNQTKQLRIVEPRTLMSMAEKSGQHLLLRFDKRREMMREKKEQLKLHFSRKQCRTVAQWLNNLAMSPQQACELMHPKRGMWVRFIRALRLAEYSKKEGFENLKALMDCFYKQNYNVLRGEMEKARLNNDADTYFKLAVKRPGQFARRLFSDMLWFGPERTLMEFRSILHQIPARLVVSLGMYAENYFDPNLNRSVCAISGLKKSIPTHYLLEQYDDDEIKKMVAEVHKLYLEYMSDRFASQNNENKTIYIDPELYNIPLSIGDRSSNIQDTSCALQGTVFPIEGSKVRLFLHWGVGLPAQHLDMDLSCHIAYEDKSEICNFCNLTTTGAQHSGDIRSIPDKIGTAEYIELDIDDLAEADARYVSFTCNAYSRGALVPDMLVGWMNSAYPMKVSETDGVAYDPSTVQHRVRISEQNLSKGLVFGILDVEKREIVWLELPFSGQTIRHLNFSYVKSYLTKLKAKTKIGELLELKADIQNLKRVDAPEKADEAYTTMWALDSAAVSKLLLG